MNKQTITFTADEQTLTKTGGIEHYASNIVSYIEASFTLGDNWAGYDSIRAVWESGYARIATVLDANNKCIVPAEVLTYKSKVNVNLVGSIVENTVLTDRLTTYPILALTVDADARVDSSETTPVTASQFEQFVDVVRDEASAIQNYTYDSEAWAVGQRAGVDVPSTDETYQNNAKYYADQGATLQQEVTDLKSELTYITGNEEIQFSDPSEKKYINLLADPVSFTPNVATVANVKYAIVPCSEGDKFTINGTGGGGDRLWAFVDSSKHILVKADSSATANNLVLTAPENATHLIINDENDQSSYIGTLVKDELHRIGNIVDKTAEYNPLSPYASATGVLKTDGTIYTGASSTINKYRDVAGRELYLNGEGGFDTTYGFCYVWFVKNGVMDSYIAATAKPQHFNHYLISVDSDIDEVWVNRSVSIDLMELTAVDQYARNKIDEIINSGEVGVQWYGKKWYAYGTSMTSVHEGTGKYPPFVADFSGLILTEKGIGGGGICNNTQIKNAVMNITDGKLEADLITLEIGANDTTAPLGTIYDTGDSTFCGALNQCIRYLQANTSAQIVVISSTNARQNSGGTSASPEVTYGTDNHTKYDQWEATRKVCEINSCYYIPMGEDANMSWARMNASNAYNSDEIHHTALGGYNLALFVWYQLRNIPCWFTSIPS